MNRSQTAACAAALAVCAFGSLSPANAVPITFSTLSVVHSFDTVSTSYNGSLPVQTEGGSVLYGTVADGTQSISFLYRVNSDGSDYQVLHTFDKALEPGALTLAGTTFYAPMGVGDGSALRSIFRINMDGTGYETLHSFPSGVSVSGPLTISGNAIYGIANGPNTPQVFRMNLDGTGFQALHLFNNPSGPMQPLGKLLLVDSTLYGVTMLGAGGKVFRMNTDGTGFSVLHSFLGGNTDGRSPEGGVITDGTWLYGTTFTGGPANDGTVYKLRLDGSDFQLVYAFKASGDAAYPNSTLLALNGSTLFGTTNGSNDQETFGTVFSVNTDGSGERVLYMGSNSQWFVTPSGVEIDGGNVIGVADFLHHPGLYAISGAVPEPNSIVLGVCALAGVALFRLGRRRLT